MKLNENKWKFVAFLLKDSLVKLMWYRKISLIKCIYS